MADKQTIIETLRKWIAQRPGLEFGNYGDLSSYRSEMRSIGRDLRDARAMVNYVAWHDSITAEMILSAANDGGRLTLTVTPCHSASQQAMYQAKRASGGILEMPPCDDWRVTIDYCTGQYWPTEYRRAVCQLMSSVIWYWLRSNLGDGCTGDDIRKSARRELGTSIARRWFK